MKRKKAMLIFPSNTLVCYDLHILDIYNRFKNHFPVEFAKGLKSDILSVFNGDPINTPLHCVREIDDKLVLCDLMTNLPSSYPSVNKFIYAKTRFMSITVYDKLIKAGYKNLVSQTPVSHKNINVVKPLDQYNNFIVYDNRNWDELSILKGIYGDSTQYIDRDKLIDWLKDNSSPTESNVLELTLVSDAFDIDRELAVETFHKYGMDVARFIDTELRICCVNPENIKRYNECHSNIRDNNRSSVGLFKLWDQSFM